MMGGTKVLVLVMKFIESPNRKYATVGPTSTIETSRVSSQELRPAREVEDSVARGICVDIASCTQKQQTDGR